MDPIPALQPVFSDLPIAAQPSFGLSLRLSMAAVYRTGRRTAHQAAGLNVAIDLRSASCPINGLVGDLEKESWKFY
jgi:hypothetical protein